jgi:bifunctional DNA-binding transcriptional regulator/antitoxin component of YhaV-PrlF toxin-antitoxin module
VVFEGDEAEVAGFGVVVASGEPRGTLILPAELRHKYGIETGDTFRLVDLDGIFVLTPVVPMVPELVREIEKVHREAGLDMDGLLAALRALRKQADGGG